MSAPDGMRFCYVCKRYVDALTFNARGHSDAKTPRLRPDPVYLTEADRQPHYTGPAPTLKRAGA